MDDNERFWIGDQWCESDTVVNHMQSTDGKWFETTDGLVLDPMYSPWSVRIYHPRTRTLSWVLKTIAIIPKSLVRNIHALLGEYIKWDEERSKVCGYSKET